MIPGSMVIWFIYMPLVAYVGPMLPWGIFLEYQGIIPVLFGNINYWLFILLVPLLANTRDYIWKL
jgi:phospholipid-transporting ATPase